MSELKLPVCLLVKHVVQAFPGGDCEQIFYLTIWFDLTSWNFNEHIVLKNIFTQSISVVLHSQKLNFLFYRLKYFVWGIWVAVTLIHVFSYSTWKVDMLIELTGWTAHCARSGHTNTCCSVVQDRKCIKLNQQWWNYTSDLLMPDLKLQSMV